MSDKYLVSTFEVACWPMWPLLVDDGTYHSMRDGMATPVSEQTYGATYRAVFWAVGASLVGHEEPA